MKKQQLVLLVVGVVVTFFLFQLPRSVVENEQLQEVSAAEETHSMDIPAEVRNRIDQLRDSLSENVDKDKKATFALALATEYLNYGITDSAVAVVDEEIAKDNAWDIQKAEIYFKAFERTMEIEKSKVYAQKARSIFEKLREKDPSNLYVRNRLAMTLVVSENPMAGIAILREIIAEDETNRLAILNLGLLAIQSGQFERAVDRFEKLISLNAADHEAKLYLAVALMETQKPAKASLLLEEILATRDSIPAIKMMAGDYLKSIEKEL
ncbi:MAG: tetratricopeptide repeat protein [Bacteroidota bacterium]